MRAALELNFPTWITMSNSLKVRIVFLMVVLVLATTGMLQFYTVHQFEKASEYNLRHEGMLLSDALEAGLYQPLQAGDVAAVQRQIDELVRSREVNDIEINVLALQDGSSQIIASNVPDNIEAADEEEHKELLKALSSGAPTLFIDTDSDDVEEDDVDPDELLEYEHSDNYLEKDARFMSITTPVWLDDGVGAGINVKLSLDVLDTKLRHLEYVLMAVMLVASIVILSGMTQLLNRKIFHPLQLMQAQLSQIAGGDYAVAVAAEQRPDEIGDLARTFNEMTVQLRQTRQRLHQYLNPMAIKAAYRRSNEQAGKPGLEEKDLSVLFVDIVGFTATSERLGPGASVDYLNAFHDLVASAIRKAGGYIDKIVADELICVFDTHNHADQAVDAARQILRDVNTFSTLEVRIGVNSGSCIVADVGSLAVKRMDRTVIGDTVNVAQRLMTRAEPGSAMLSLSTYRQLDHIAGDIRDCQMQFLKGKSFPVKAFELRRTESVSPGRNAAGARGLALVSQA